MLSLPQLNAMTVSEIKAMILSAPIKAKYQWVEILKNDSRQSINKMAMQVEKQIAVYEKEQNRLVKIVEFENQAKRMGYKLIAGLDEAGRGPLIGPVVAAAVILPEEMDLTGIDDSKKLSEVQREALYDKIVTHAVAYGVGVATHEEIDTINILNATKLAMKRAIEAMSMSPDYLLIDAVKLNEISIVQESIIKGDSRSVSIAAASIIAKVARDRMLKEMDKKYPMYGLASHKGYGTDQHYQAIREHGILPEHRRSFLKGLNYEDNAK
ncbi:MAG: ribonuclease HII [Clostridiales bacterium 38-18]|nr:MAG: ribonuclease HII [Clostridiales bacterium 38-18]